MRSALAVGARVLIDAITPPEALAPSVWAARHLIVPDGPRKLDRWDPALTPYVREPLDMTAADDPATEIVVMKSAQTGFTTLLLAGIGHTIDREPCDQMVVQPTDGALTDFNSQKLQTAIDASAALSAKVAPQVARAGGRASTTYEKRYGFYALTLALASSTADLRSKSVRKVWLDEIDEYADDLDGQGSPFDMVAARQESFLRTGGWKRVYVSTPTIKGGSHVERLWEASDKRRWHVTCPHCRTDGRPSEFVFEFGANFVFAREHPFRAHYVAPCCGAVVEEHEKYALVRAGRWLATEPAPGRMPGFHFDALSSPFVPWAEIAKRAVAAGDDPSKLKSFTNLTLGLPYEVRGDAPETVRLMERREVHLVRGRVPPRGLLLVAAADVQMRGIWFSVTAYAPNRERWLVEADHIEGDTASPEAPVFADLRRRVLDAEFADAFGRTRKVDALGIDTGYRAHVVYAWARAAQRFNPDTGRDVILPLKGMDGWGLPAIGAPKLMDIALDGRRIRQGVKLWPVGTWPLKGAYYADLRRDGLAAGRDRDPDGYCHFGTWTERVPGDFFEQLTAEYLAVERYRGRERRIWKLRAGQRDNHFLDCAVYADAIAEYLGLSSLAPEDWAALARRRGLPDEATIESLFTAVPAARHTPAETLASPTPPPAVAKPEPVPAPSANWLGRPTSGWLRR